MITFVPQNTDLFCASIFVLQLTSVLECFYFHFSVEFISIKIRCKNCWFCGIYFKGVRSVGQALVSWVSVKVACGMMWITHLEGGPKRVNHAAVSVNHKVYSFGGYCTEENSREYTSMDVHVLNTTTFRWTKHPVSDLSYFENDDIMPYKCYGHTAVVYGSKVYIWGGRNDRSCCSVLFCFDTVWHCWTAPPTTGCIAARDGHTSCVWRNYMIVFGGYEEDTHGFARLTYILDLEKMHWSMANTKGIEPAPRDFHTAVVINNRMYVFGGRSIVYDALYRRQEVYSNDVRYLDLIKMQWVQCEVLGDKPLGRRSHSAFVYRGKMYIFGGYNSIEDKHFNDMYEFDPNTNIWKRIRGLGEQPCARRRQACVLVGNRVFLFGGTSSEYSPFQAESDNDRLMDHSDMYVWDLEPSLKTLALMAVRKYKLDDSILPDILRMDIRNMFTPNKITLNRPNNSAG